MPKPPPLVITLLLLLLLSFLLSSNNALTHQHHLFREAPQFYNSPSCPSIQYPPNNRTSPVHKEEEEEEKGGKGVSDDICSDQAVHVAMTLDATYLRGSIAAVHSILQHSSCPENVNFHFITAAAYAEHGGAALSNSFPYLRFRIYPFRAAAAVSRLISASIRTALNCPLNYARSYLADTLPACVRRVVYLDSDLVLVDDVAKLAATPLGATAVLAAPEYCNANFSSYFTDSFWSHPSLPLTFAGRRACYFNTGVMVMDLARWRTGGFTARIEEWMEVQKRTRIYQLGSLPPFLLVFAGNIGTVDHRWNQHGLGGDNFRGLCRNLHAGPVSLLHWSGKGKPWARLDANRPCPLDALWAPYDLLRTPFALDS